MVVKNPVLKLTNATCPEKDFKNTDMSKCSANFAEPNSQEKLATPKAKQFGKYL